MTETEPEPGLPSPNRRVGVRSRAIKTGKLIFGGTSPTIINCAVIEMSEAGGRVETGIMAHVPELLVLELSGGAQRRCIRRWAIGNQIGLEFLPAAEPP